MSVRSRGIGGANADAPGALLISTPPLGLQLLLTDPMDKSKRSDLLAAGRKKLRQFRQKKDQKGGGKDGQSSSNGIKLEKDVDPGERTKKISEPDPGTLTSAIDSDVSEMDLLDPSSAVHHVDLRGVDSAQVVDQGSQDEGGDAEQAPIELPVVGEGSSSAFEIVHEVLCRK